jgi:hypothetical protein
MMAEENEDWCINKESQVTMEKAVTFIKHGSDNLKMEIKHLHAPTHATLHIFYLYKKVMQRCDESSEIMKFHVTIPMTC